MGLFLNAWVQFRAGKSWFYIVAYSCRTVFYPLNAMWYLWASIIGVVILGFIYLRCRHWKFIWVVYSVIAYCVLLLCNNYYFLVEGTSLQAVITSYCRVFVSARNGVFLAPVFLGMGFVLREDRVKNWLLNHKKIPILTTFVGLALLFVESCLLYRLPAIDDRGYFISLLFVVPSIVSIGLLYNMKIKLPYRLLRRLSTSLFFVHATIIHIIQLIAGDGVNTVLLFSITVIISLVVAFISYRSKNKTISIFFG